VIRFLFYEKFGFFEIQRNSRWVSCRPFSKSGLKRPPLLRFEGGI